MFVWCAHEHLPGYMNKMAEFPFPRMIDSHALQCLLWTGVHCNSICVAKGLCRCFFFSCVSFALVFSLQQLVSLIEGGRYTERNEHADSSQHLVLDSQRVKSHLFSRDLLIHEQPMQSVLESQRIRNHFYSV